MQQRKPNDYNRTLWTSKMTIPASVNRDTMNGFVTNSMITTERSGRYKSLS
jgi:hypothetical protein